MRLVRNGNMLEHWAWGPGDMPGQFRKLYQADLSDWPGGDHAAGGDHTGSNFAFGLNFSAGVDTSDYHFRSIVVEEMASANEGNDETGDGNAEEEPRDRDLDRLRGWQEAEASRANPTIPDSDGDGVDDNHDNCPAVSNPDQLDSDLNRIASFDFNDGAFAPAEEIDWWTARLRGSPAASVQQGKLVFDRTWTRSLVPAPCSRILRPSSSPEF